MNRSLKKLNYCLTLVLFAFVAMGTFGSGTTSEQSTATFITAHARAAEILIDLHNCMAEKFNADNSYVPNQGKYNRFRAGYIALIASIRIDNYTEEDFANAVDNFVTPGLEAFVAADDLSCNAYDLTANAMRPFPDFAPMPNFILEID